MSVQDCQALIDTVLYHPTYGYTREKTGRGVLRGEWTLILHFPGIRASLHASYDGPDNARDKFLQIHGKPRLRDVLNQLAQYGAGQQMSYQTGRDSFTFTFTAARFMLQISQLNYKILRMLLKVHL
ncbi:hypothetical protein IWW34DRAFT_634298 [Fusarium oxysporum f. sp. albedinis]|uniref:Uncharacterized protein n=1 Tax=Fusarium oxysporum (strain Fo5176) TaxID=660025 RepID=F9FSS1_FUSOF|nr:hypothetical protein FOXB_09452 [Fusarium oxysporum f. sp. conglutinans Fo5176]KAI3573883.1 hypothetical protein IWW34DRAFT_634298 [Fusarium oxysporum f. sp. albedinis]